MSPEAGWYADPTDPSAVRWWDGAQWTAQTRPAPRELAHAGAAAPSSTSSAATGGGRHAAPPRTQASSRSAEPTPSPAPAAASDHVPTVTAPVPSPAATAAPVPTVSAPAATTVATPAPGTDPGAADRSRPGSSPPLSAPATADVVDRSRPGSTPTMLDGAGAVDRSRPGSNPPRTAPAADAAAVDRSRPGSAPVMLADPADAADRSRPGSRPAAVLAPAAPTAPVVTATAWVDSVGSASPSGPGFAPAGFTPTAGFGSAPLGVDPTIAASPYPGPMVRRSRKGPVIALVVVLLLVAAGAVLGVPRYLAAQAVAVADAQPDVLVHAAPATLAGQHRVAVAGVRTDAVASSMTSAGATWAWAQTYGTSSALTIYLASDVPLAERPTAVRALTSHDAATDLLATVSKGLAAGANGSLVTGAPTEYASPVAGKTWCMPITVSGVAGGYCLWTSGKELLQTLSLPGLQEVAAKSTLDALKQMVKTVTKTAGGPVSALVPKPSATA